MKFSKLYTHHKLKKRVFAVEEISQNRTISSRNLSPELSKDSVSNKEANCRTKVVVFDETIRNTLIESEKHETFRKSCTNVQKVLCESTKSHVR